MRTGLWSGRRGKKRVKSSKGGILEMFARISFHKRSFGHMYNIHFLPFFSRHLSNEKNDHQTLEREETYSIPVLVSNRALEQLRFSVVFCSFKCDQRW